VEWVAAVTTAGRHGGSESDGRANAMTIVVGGTWAVNTRRWKEETKSVTCSKGGRRSTGKGHAPGGDAVLLCSQRTKVERNRVTTKRGCCLGTGGDKSKPRKRQAVNA